MLLKSAGLAKLRKSLKDRHKRLVFTTGTFDLLHAGHARYLAEAASAGDYLVVGVESDASYFKRKGIRTILHQKVRAEMLAYFRAVDSVVIIDEQNLIPIIKALQPDVFYTIKDTWAAGGHRHRAEASAVRSYGGKIIRSVKYEPYSSSAKLVQRIAEKKLASIIDQFLDKELCTISASAIAPISMSSQIPRDILGLTFKGSVVNFTSLGDVHRQCAARHQKIVFTAGSFDLIHIGHARYLERARSLGDVLVVGLPSNVAVERMKGKGRPLMDEVVRAETLTYLRSVDYVVIFDHPTILQCLEKLQPDVFFTVEESWNKGLRQSPEYKLVKSYGGEVAQSPRLSPYLSASLIINKAAGELVKQIFKECLESATKNGALKEGKG